MKTSRLLLLAALLIAAAVPMMAQVNDTYVIPAAANAQGGFGSRWMTRFSIFNPHLDYPLRISITFVPTGGAPGIEEVIDLPENASAFSDNILGDLFGVQQASGSLLVAAFQEDNPGVPADAFSRSFLVTSDTYNNNSGGGTYGQTIAGTWTGLLDYEFDQISAVAHGIRNAGKWRTNVGALNLGRCTVTVRLNVYDADGNEVAHQVPFLVPPLGHMQQGLPVSVDRATVEFFVEDPCVNDDDLYAIVFPYTSTIDGESNDPAYQSPALLASTDVLFAKGQKIDPTAFGKKIDAAYARNVRAQAERRGVASLKKTEQGWAIAK